jgi:integrase
VGAQGLPGRRPVSGKQRSATKTVRAGKREAQRLLNEMKVEAERGLATRTTATVGELLDRWLELAREDFSPKTTRETAGYIERNLRPALGDVRLSKLTTASLDRYYRSLLVDGGRKGRPLAPGTIRRIHGILRRALAQGVRWGWLGVNPAAAASPPRVPMPEIAPPTPAQLTLIIARFAQRLDVTPPATAKPGPIGMVVNRPRGGVPFQVSRRTWSRTNAIGTRVDGEPNAELRAS